MSHLNLRAQKWYVTRLRTTAREVFLKSWLSALILTDDVPHYSQCASEGEVDGRVTRLQGGASAGSTLDENDIDEETM